MCRLWSRPASPGEACSNPARVSGARHIVRGQSGSQWEDVVYRVGGVSQSRRRSSEWEEFLMGGFLREEVVV